MYNISFGVSNSFCDSYHQHRAAQAPGWHQLSPPPLWSKWSDDSHLHPTPLSPTEYTPAAVHTQTTQKGRLHRCRMVVSAVLVSVCARVYASNHARYLCTGSILQCDGESAAAAALCQDVLTRSRLEKRPTVKRRHKHITYHRALR